MKMPKLKIAVMWLMILVMLIGLCGCYYRVTDPSTGNVYYTKEVKEAGGSTKFVDGKTGNAVTITNSEVEEISEQEYKQGIYSD